MVGNLVTLSLYGLFQYHSDIKSKLIPSMTLSFFLHTEKPIAKRKCLKDLTFASFSQFRSLIANFLGEIYFPAHGLKRVFSLYFLTNLKRDSSVTDGFHGPNVQQAGSICITNLKLKDIQVVVNLFFPKNGNTFFKFLLAQLACRFAWIYKYLQASCIQLFQRYVVKNLTKSCFYLSTLNFVIICIAIFFFFLCAIRCANFSCFKNCAKMQKSLKTVKFITLKLV